MRPGEDENQEAAGVGGGGDVNICQSHTVVKQVAEGNFNMWDSNYFDGNSHWAAAGVNSQLRPLGRCCDEALSLVQRLTIQNQNSSRRNAFPRRQNNKQGEDSERLQEGGASGGNSMVAWTAKHQ